MSAREHLDQLDALRANAALGTLRVGQHYGIHLYAGDNPVGTTLRAADASLIVGAVNALEKHTAALRAVLGLHKNDQSGAAAPVDPGMCEICMWVWPCPTVRAITEALDRP